MTEALHVPQNVVHLDCSTPKTVILLLLLLFQTSAEPSALLCFSPHTQDTAQEREQGVAVKQTWIIFFHCFHSVTYFFLLSPPSSVRKNLILTSVHSYISKTLTYRLIKVFSVL